MSMREDDDISVKICKDSSNDWKSVKEMKEYLRSEFHKKAAWVSICGGETYLHFAAFLGDIEATNILLIEENAQVNVVDNGKRSPLHLAAEKGHVDVAKVLIQSGADVNAVHKL